MKQRFLAGAKTKKEEDCFATTNTTTMIRQLRPAAHIHHQQRQQAGRRRRLLRVESNNDVPHQQAGCSPPPPPPPAPNHHHVRSIHTQRSFKSSSADTPPKSTKANASPHCAPAAACAKRAHGCPGCSGTRAAGSVADARRSPRPKRRRLLLGTSPSKPPKARRVLAAGENTRECEQRGCAPCAAFRHVKVFVSCAQGVGGNRKGSQAGADQATALAASLCGPASASCGVWSFSCCRLTLLGSLRLKGNCTSIHRWAGGADSAI